MQDNRFTYSPALNNPALRPLSFQDFYARTTTTQPPLELPKWTPPLTPALPTTYAPPAFSSAYSPTPPAFTPSSFIASLPPNRQVTFGQGTQSTSEPVRITFNQNSSTSAFVPAYSSAVKPVVVASEEAKKTDLPPPSLAGEKEAVNTFVVDTNDFKYVKEDEFTGCFHCFSPVTFDTKAKKGLCG